MPTPTYVPLGTITLASTDSEIVFSSIPATYRDLILIANCKPVSGGNANLVMKFNGATTGFSRVIAYGDSGGAVSVTSATELIAQFNDSTNFEVGVNQIMDYAQTDKHKTVLTKTNEANSLVSMQAQRWASTDAIHTISLAYSVNIDTGSTFSLYGVN